MPEIIRPFQLARNPRLAVIDFDGTLSLFRAGWADIMVGMMFEVLKPLPGTTESDAELTEFISHFVLEMAGKSTIFQMEHFVNAARERGGHPESPDHYTRTFLDVLNSTAEQRIAALKSGELAADDLLVPGALTLLTDLRARGVQMTLASGTPVELVRREAELLGIAHFFEGRIFGPKEDWRAFSKLAVMRKILADAKASGSDLLGFGDGFVETENAKELGGIAIGCATDETNRSGRVEVRKRTHLIRAGADIIVADYCKWDKLTELLFPNRV